MLLKRKKTWAGPSMPHQVPRSTMRTKKGPTPFFRRVPQSSSCEISPVSVWPMWSDLFDFGLFSRCIPPWADAALMPRNHKCAPR